MELKNAMQEYAVNPDQESQIVFERESWDEFFTNHIWKQQFYQFAITTGLLKPGDFILEGEARNPVAESDAIMDFRGVNRGRSPLLIYEQP